MLFQAALEKDVGVVADDIWLTLTVERHNSRCVHVFNLVSAEKNSLAEEVTEDVVRADKLHPPIESV